MRGERFRISSPGRRWREILLLLSLSLVWAGAAALAQAAPPAQSAKEGQAIFQEKCAACHTIGGGKRVGPDLQGVTARRDRAWLMRWIKAPDLMLAAGDPIATQLLKEYNNVPMPNLRLTDPQVEALIAYLENPEAAAEASRSAALPSLYFPTLIASLIALGGLTAAGLLTARKRVEVRP